MTYDELLKKLISGENFSFSRYGDGEINAILGSKQKHNCDGHEYFLDMGIRLYKIIKSKPKYIMGLQNLVQNLRKDDAEFHKLIEGIDWVDSDIIHRASIKGDLYGLFDALSDRDIILVSKEGLAGITFELTGMRPFDHIVINEKDCWLDYKEILYKILAKINPNTVILYCAGMPTEVFIDEVFNHFKDAVTQIDIGSAFDPYCGYSIRSYHDDVIKKL